MYSFPLRPRFDGSGLHRAAISVISHACILSSIRDLRNHSTGDDVCAGTSSRVAYTQLYDHDVEKCIGKTTAQPRSCFVPKPSIPPGALPDSRLFAGGRLLPPHARDLMGMCRSVLRHVLDLRILFHCLSPSICESFR